jgi:hypothetical protein
MTTTLTLIAATLLAADGPATKATYYLGESKVMTADGKSLGNMVMLVKRELRPAESRIIETVLMVSSRRDEPIKEYLTVLTVKGSRFTMREQSGAFSGSGELEGNPWEWSGWTSTSKMPGQNGGTIVSRDKLTERGMATSKELSGPDGTVRVKFAEDYAAIDGGTYELLHAKLLPREIRGGERPR